MRRTRRIISYGLLGFLLLCLAAGAVSALSNRNLPTSPPNLDRLDPVDKARLEETLHLKRELGSAVWPGWGEVDIPVILWNGKTAFLTGFSDPSQAGDADWNWQVVSQDTFIGQPYYRQTWEDPQNFAVQIGDRWVGSLATKGEVDRFLIEMFHQMLPPVVEDVFPYRLFIQPSEVQITGVLHETFHAYQAQVAGMKLEQAEAAYRLEDQYWQLDEAMRKDWKEEVGLLAKAVQAETDEQRFELTRQWADKRAERRNNARMNAELTGFERLLEWEEGLAKYVELTIWRQAAQTAAYIPLEGMAADPDFKGYSTFKQRWTQEISQMKRQAGQDGVTRFYYTGMAQAVLLDRLGVDWKNAIMAEGVWLDDLLASAVQ